MNGLHPELTYMQYAEAEGVRFSFFDGATPAHWRERQFNRAEDTAALRFGRYLHAYVFDGWRDFVTRPEGLDLRTKAGKEWSVEHLNKIVISHDDKKALEGMYCSILEATDEAGGFYLRKALEGKTEVSCFALDESTGLTMKARFDLLPPPGMFREGYAIPDLKSCVSAADFERDILKYRYYARAAWYLDTAAKAGLTATEFWLIAAEKTPPYPIRVLKLTSDWPGVEYGRVEYRKQLKTLKRCIENKEWPAFNTAPQDWIAPEWMSARLEHAPGHSQPQQPETELEDCNV